MNNTPSPDSSSGTSPKTPSPLIGLGILAVVIGIPVVAGSAYMHENTAAEAASSKRDALIAEQLRQTSFTLPPELNSGDVDWTTAEGIARAAHKILTPEQLANPNTILFSGTITRNGEATDFDFKVSDVAKLGPAMEWLETHLPANSMQDMVTTRRRSTSPRR